MPLLTDPSSINEPLVPEPDSPSQIITNAIVSTRVYNRDEIPEALSPRISDKLLSRYPEILRELKTGNNPLGYSRKVGDPKSLVPVWEMVLVLEQALDAIDAGTNLRDAADFVNSHESRNRNVSPMALSNLWNKQRGSDPNNPRAQKLKAFRDAIKPKTTAEKKRKSKQMKLANAKKSLNYQHKKVLRQAEELRVYKTKKKNEEHIEKVKEDLSKFSIKTIPQEEISLINEKPLFSPNPGPQTEFLGASEQEVLYGGAAGGGKSYALIADPMRYFTNPNFVGLILRRTNDELRELIQKSQQLYPLVFKNARYHTQDKEWRFPSGARLWMTYLERDDDVYRYQGQSFSYIAFDELTQHPTPFAWNYMRSRLRSADSSLPLLMRATTNPGSIGHAWVKKMFVDPAPAGKAFWAQNIETGETLVYPKGHSREGQPLFQRRFIPAKASDNPYIWADGAYEANLLSLPEQQRKQLLEGDWNIADGAAFSEFREHIHVIEPFEIPHDWRRFRSCDFGYSSQSVVHWYAVAPGTDQLIVYDELAVTKKTAIELADLILEKEENQRISYGVLDSSCWNIKGTTGPTIAEEMIRRGCSWRRSDRSPGSRTAGKNRLHTLLRVDPVLGVPGIVFFNNCRQIITDLPVIPVDPNGKEDIDERCLYDHAYDSIRYGIQSRPRAIDPFFEYKSHQSRYIPSDGTYGY